MAENYLNNPFLPPRPPAPLGYHYMPDGTLMKGKTHNEVEKETPLVKKIYNRDSYNNTINTTFTELSPPVPEEEPTPTVEDFFELYDELFFEIPKEGDSNSHQYLVQQSSDYANTSTQGPDIQALLDEITQLREENLTLQQEVLDALFFTSASQQDIPE